MKFASTLQNAGAAARAARGTDCISIVGPGAGHQDIGGGGSGWAGVAVVRQPRATYTEGLVTRRAQHSSSWAGQHTSPKPAVGAAGQTTRLGPGAVSAKQQVGALTGLQPADRQIASLTFQCRQVYSLVKIALSAPSWCPSRQRGEFSGLPCWREQPNQNSHRKIVSGLFNIPNPQKKSQKKSSTIRSVLAVPSPCPERPYLSKTFINLNNSLNRESKEWQNK